MAAVSFARGPQGREIMHFYARFITFHLNLSTKYDLDRIAWPAFKQGPKLAIQRVTWQAGKVYRPLLKLGIALYGQNIPSKQRS